MGNHKSSVSGLYIFLVSVVSFLLAVLFFWLSNLVSEKMQSLWLSVVFLIVIVLVGILADIVGVSVTAASEAPLHAKAAKKVPGAAEGVFLIRNADRVANLMNDVVGDIAGTVSGALGIALALQILTYWRETGQLLVNMLLTALIAAATVGGKAYGKRIALVHADEVVFVAGKFLRGVFLITGRDFSARHKKTSR
ncbi:MAG: hypothetical protein VR68_06235 [Peptococcaceae bacterium BRH_c4a]|nr:MAG: hypothetical protein VR68_06235 [Peptococcaceae bacterium BRH_c4a]